MTIRVLLADDHSIVRQGVRSVLAPFSDLEILREDAATAEEAVRLARLHRPDALLLDLQFIGGDKRGTEVISALTSTEHPPAVIVLTTYDNDQDVLEAISAGASSYLLKDTPGAEIADAIRRAVSGESVVDQRVQQRLTSDSALTPREREVLVLLARGATNAEISRELFLSQATVKTHLVRIFDKLQARTRTEAVAAARAHGVLRPDG